MAQGKLIVITAPSGAGKTTIAKHLLRHYPQLAFSVSATTRQVRAGEKEGIDYFFISAEEFKLKIKRDEFVEWEQVYQGLYYGTLKSEIERLWRENKIVLFDVDVKGAVNLKKKFPLQTLTIFIKPPSPEILIERLHTRATDSKEKIEERIKKAEHELTFEKEFDCVIVNDSLKTALYQAEETVRKFL